MAEPTATPVKITDLTDQQKVLLIQNRWDSGSSLWDELEKIYDKNTKVYDNKPDWLENLPRKKHKVRANRIFTDTEAVINSLIANPAKPNALPTRNSDQSRALASTIESYLGIKYTELNIKEVQRKGLRNLYFARMVVLKPFWNSKTNDFDVRAVDPRKVRVHKSASKEIESEFTIEEVTDNLGAVLTRFPKQRVALLEHFGYTEQRAVEILIQNPEVTYHEAWIKDRLMCKLDTLLLDDVPNPYWDWDGIMITPEEEQQMQESYGPNRRRLMQQIRGQQAARKGKPAGIDVDNAEKPISYKAYYFNHFNTPRKPYIFATIFNSDNSPIGRTSMIEQASPLQEALDRRKRQIDDNAELVNGILKIDKKVMGQAEAEKIRFETGGLIYGVGVKDGVIRETGTPLPEFVIKDLQDSREEIDNIMAASSAFKGQREGQETKAGRLALVDQSFLMLNELVQVVDFINYELFNWFYQLMKCRYTEYHYAKVMGKDQAVQTLEIIQDDFETGTEIRIIAGKTLPEDRQFKYERAQNDVKEGLIAPVDYFEAAGYDEPKRIAKNAVAYKINPLAAVGMTPEEMQAIAPPPKPQAQQGPNLSESISFKDLPPDGKVQMAAQAGIQLSPNGVMQHEQDQKTQDTAHQIIQHAAKTAMTPKPLTPKSNGKKPAPGVRAA